MSAERYRTYRDFSGLDLSKSPGDISESCFAALRNMWRDPRRAHGGAIETAPGFRRLAAFSGKVHGIFRQKVGGVSYLLVHAGRGLYRFPLADRHKSATLAALSPIGTLADADSVALPLGEEVYLLDGEGYYRIDKEGVFSSIGGADCAIAYIPTTFHNGEEYEQRNLLTPVVRESFSIDDCSTYADASEGLVYSIIDAEGFEVSVAGSITHRHLEYVKVPEKVMLRGKFYTVTEVAAKAFHNYTAMRSLSLPATVRKLGVSAFRNCTALRTLSLPDALTYISSFCFRDCAALEEIHLNAALQQVFFTAFPGEGALQNVYYPLDEEAFGSIRFTDDDPFPNATIHYNTVAEPALPECYLFPINTPAARVLSVTLDGASVPTTEGEVWGTQMYYETLSDDASHITAVRLTVEDYTVPPRAKLGDQLAGRGGGGGAKERRQLRKRNGRCHRHSPMHEIHPF